MTSRSGGGGGSGSRRTAESVSRNSMNLCYDNVHLRYKPHFSSREPYSSPEAPFVAPPAGQVRNQDNLPQMQVG